MCTPVLLLVCFLVLWTPNPKTERTFCFCLDIKHRIPANENVLHTEKLCCSKITQDSSLQHLREFPESPEECWDCTLGPCETFPKSKIGVRLFLRKEVVALLEKTDPLASTALKCLAYLKGSQSSLIILTMTLHSTNESNFCLSSCKNNILCNIY